VEGLIRILLVDDHPVVVSGLRAALETQADLRVMATASSLEEARSALRGREFDVALVDLRLPDGSGMELLDEGRSDNATPAIIYLTTFDAPQYAEVAARLGASGFLLKTAPIETIVDAVRRVAAGQVAFTREQLRPSNRPAWKPLTVRELSVIGRVVAGRSNDEIATDLHLSPKTVEWYLARLFERFDVASRTELATLAQRQGWLDLPPGRGPKPPG
jgi:DNA-binding NarL/FixJ family response regulator